MEIVQIINDGSFGHNQWNEFVSFDGADVESNQVFQDFLVAPVEAQPAPQYYVVEGDGSILTLVDGNNFAILAPEEDDEIPSHKLDHMYAKKPREPGTELSKPVRRRSKKKELLKNQYLVQEMMYDPPPKINIIRGRHAMNTAGYSRPKILSSPQKNTLPSTNMLGNSRCSSLTNFSQLPKHGIKKPEDVSQAVIFEEYEEYNAPSPGAVVTVCDGIEMDPVVLTTRAVKPRKVNYHNISSGQSPLFIENRNSSLDSIGDPEDESELFLDFPMEEGEEVDASIDVDFSEISTASANSMDMIRSAPVNFHQSNVSDESDFSVAVSEPVMVGGAEQDHLQIAEQRTHHQSVFGESTFSYINGTIVKEENVEEIVVGALSGVNEEELVSYTECINDSTMVTEVNKNPVNVRQPAQSLMLLPTRRSTRPIKAPSRLDDVDDVSSMKRRRR